jgi:hypothetical protein
LTPDAHPSFKGLIMKDTKRAQRRFELRKKKKEAKKVLINCWYIKNPTDKIVGRHADNLAMCSCTMCGNPRKYFNKPTIQEKRVDELFRSSATTRFL